MTDIYWGQSVVKPPSGEAAISITKSEGENWYRISDADRLPPFLMTLVSASDHWMYVSSKGGLTCGRRDPDGALFPYETDDRIHRCHSTTGPVAALLVEKSGKTLLWKPFSDDARVYGIERNLYKNLVGNKLKFEEINHDLGLLFCYTWSSSERFGFVRTSRLQNLGEEVLQIRVLDGIRNLLPQGVLQAQQSSQSTLLDAYKRAEKVASQTAAIYSLSSRLTDRAEPSEALRATFAWSLGLDNPVVLLSEDQLENFCSGASIETEEFSRGKRAAFLVSTTLEAGPGASHEWLTLADVDLGPVELENLLNTDKNALNRDTIEQDVSRGSDRLCELVGQADGFQSSSDALVSGRHFSNTLFNIMRGGVFHDGYQYPKYDFLTSVGSRNASLEEVFRQLLKENGTSVPRDRVIEVASQSGTPHLERLALEYLPLKFSRRHGDPSRPWNHFSIDIKGENGEDRLSYQGNWRDIFQNWEALAISYPEYIESFIAKFVNASTADGYNPYRIYKHGIDWEVLDPDEPWSNIGYWGDHQVNYLTPLLEFSRRYHPGRVEQQLHRKIFVYADVPYRIKDYESLVSDPANTIEFDDAHAQAIASRVKAMGTDGKLVFGPDKQIIQVTLLEKLLLAALVKLGNFVPGGGIWMNTQRPEWNDANNALVGHGLSMVTLCYLRRYMALLADLVRLDTREEHQLSGEVFHYFMAQEAQFQAHGDAIIAGVDDAQRKLILDALGDNSAQHRQRVYGGLSGQETGLDRTRILTFLTRVVDILDATIRQNKRPDGLYHAYNLIHFDVDGYRVGRLSEMLEGQVAVLNSQSLDSEESVALLDALRVSALYRPDQNSYILYPDRVLPDFLEKNIIADALVENFPGLKTAPGTELKRYLERDACGKMHFKGRFRNVGVLRAELKSDQSIQAEAADALCVIYETVFDHRAFTGRSGSMCKYEGLGCIYWHMVSKLLLATMEVINRTDRDSGFHDQLVRHFDQIRSGIGLHKSPVEYGAFPTDPYSHTPSFIGVQQPGMTGQVKEDIIVRFRELGITVRDGSLSFKPVILSRSEFSDAGDGSLDFSLCSVPVTYTVSDQPGIQLITNDGKETSIKGNCLPREWSQALFSRDGSIEKIAVDIPAEQLRP